jgi:hypothetical protein
VKAGESTRVGRDSALAGNLGAAMGRLAGLHRAQRSLGNVPHGEILTWATGCRAGRKRNGTAPRRPFGFAVAACDTSTSQPGRPAVAGGPSAEKGGRAP